jgi:glucosamine-6-phosphate deaminase
MTARPTVLVEPQTRLPLIVLATAEAVHRHFSDAIADEIATHNAVHQPTRLILPVGPTGQYSLLAERCNAERISWRDVHVVQMDEYLDWQGRRVPVDHPLSLTGRLGRFFADLDHKLRPQPHHWHVPNVSNPDVIPAAIDDMGGIDTCYAGIGIHGHIAFNEPPNRGYVRIGLDEFAESGVRVVSLTPETVVMNATRSWDGRLSDFPPLAITVGMAQVLGARRIRLYCDGGGWQREALAQALYGRVSVDFPVTLAQRHPDAAVVASIETAAPLLLPSPPATTERRTQ